ncbi:hypothetical protein EPUS_00556 [Endocarpon pusillum Z07020]|uniref:Uncharacterized protein n=1 Tax=Endocarpon pusillum (strain Z07020 / HMAS-L-300199) TaxID=1263415 RepID=U1G2Q7_ENDPU|nr:uncharacterized protein EPUS_00556 [Endocarpon pusillum Z07020]ERF71567.1 hypothetical protein EPUS_00556 [Endocarpon pusillum Z07020]
MAYQRLDQAASSQPQAFPTNISSYFRRPTKVVKTNSRGSSPKNLSRRRTTASHSTRHHVASKGSISNYNTPVGGSNNTVATTRPTSWHPNSAAKATPMNDWMSSCQFPDSTYATYFPNSFATTEVNGLVTPLTQPSSAESCYQEAFTPLEEMQFQNLDNTYSFPSQAGQDAFWLPQQPLTLRYPIHQPSIYQQSLPSDHQIPFTYTSAPDLTTGTAPPTPDLVAISNDAVGESGKPSVVPQTEDEVLVGMGLYDAPSPSNFTTSHERQMVLPHRGSAGKGLKLEETFHPSNEDASESEDDLSNDEDEETEATDPFLSAPDHQKSQPSELASHPAIATLADQSFFFENDPDGDQLQQAHEQHFTAPIWTDVYSGAPCQWI